MGGLFKRKDPLIQLTETMSSRVPPGWSGANIVVVPAQGGHRVLVLNPANDDEELLVNQAIADAVMSVISTSPQPPQWRAAQIAMTRKNEAEWGLDVHFDVQ